MHLHRAEQIWVVSGIVALVIFLAIIGGAALSDGIVPPSHVQTIDPTKVAVTPPFDHPGVRRVGKDAVEAYVVMLDARHDFVDDGFGTRMHSTNIDLEWLAVRQISDRNATGLMFNARRS